MASSGMSRYLLSQVGLEAREVVGDGVVGHRVDVGELDAERLGDAGELVRAGGREAALLDTRDGREVHVGLLGELPDRQSELLAARADEAS